MLTDEDVLLDVAIDAFQITGDICERDFLAPPNGCYRLVAKLNPAAVEPLIRIISCDFQQAAARGLCQHITNGMNGFRSGRPARTTVGDVSCSAFNSTLWLSNPSRIAWALTPALRIPSAISMALPTDWKIGFK